LRQRKVVGEGTSMRVAGRRRQRFEQNAIEDTVRTKTNGSCSVLILMMMLCPQTRFLYLFVVLVRLIIE